MVVLATFAFTDGRASAQNVTATWLQPVSGYWVTTSNWSSAPYYPNNGSPAGSTYDVQIPTSGSPYNVTLGSNVTVDNLTVGSGATFQFLMGGSQTLSVNQILTLQNGSQVQLNSGNFTGGTINGYGTASLIGSLNNLYTNVFTNVTLNATLVIPDGNSAVFAGTTSLGSNGVVSINGQQNALKLGTTLTGSGQVVFNGSLANEYGNIGPYGSVSTMTIASGVTITTGTSNGAIGGVINQGTMLALNNHILQVTLADNQGSMQATSGGTIDILGTGWTNEGSITAANGGIIASSVPAAGSTGVFSVQNGTFDMSTGTSTVAAIDALKIQNSYIKVDASGRINNSGAVLNVVDGTNTWQLLGTILGGTISAPAGVPLEVLPLVNNYSNSMAALSGVTLSAGIKVDGGAIISMSAGTSISNQKLVMISGLSVPQNHPTQLTIDTTDSFSNNTIIELDGSGVQNFVNTSVVPQALTIICGTGGGTISGSAGTLTINGKVSAVTANQPLTLFSGTITNHGTLVASNDLMSVPKFTSENTNGPVPVSFASDGFIELDPGGALNIAGSFNQSSAGDIQFGIAGAAQSSFGVLTTTGNIQLNGELIVVTPVGFQPYTGEQFLLINTSAGSISGTFATQNFQTNGQQYIVTYNPTNVTITAVPESRTTAAATMLAMGCIAHRRRRDFNVTV